MPESSPNAAASLRFAPATELAARIARRELSPVELMDAVLEAIERLEPRLNAFISVSSKARAQAERAEAAIRAGEPLGPLHGIPFSAKDLLNTAGLRTTFGSYAFEHNVPARSCIAVQRVLDAGAILIGKTTTPEFGHKPLTEAPLFGRTCNPWSLERTPGGSSGGAAAAVAAGLGPLAIGTDGGGSIRIPAAACGIVGMKQTLGVVPHDQAPDSFGLLAYIGPMTRTVADAGLLLEVMAGPHRSDPNSKGRELSGLAVAARDGVDLRGKRVGYARMLGNTAIDTETAALVDAAVSVIEELGASVEVLPDDLPPTISTWGPLTFSIWAQRFGHHESTLGERMSASLQHWMRAGRSVTGLQVQAAMAARTAVYRQVESWFERFDLIVTPTLACPALAIDFDPLGDIEINGEAAGGPREAWYPYTHPFNLTGHPAITVPCGWTAAGLPVGLQIVGPYLHDAEVLGAARRFENARPWRQHLPPDVD